MQLLNRKATLLHPDQLQAAGSHTLIKQRGAATPFFSTTTTSVWTPGGILSDQNSASPPIVYPGSGESDRQKDYAQLDFCSRRIQV